MSTCCQILTSQASTGINLIMSCTEASYTIWRSTAQEQQIIVTFERLTVRHVVAPIMRFLNVAASESDRTICSGVAWLRDRSHW